MPIRVKARAEHAGRGRAGRAGVPGGRLFPKESDLANVLLVTATEMTTDDDMERLATALAEVTK